MLYRTRLTKRYSHTRGFGQLQIQQTSELQQASETLQATKQNPSDAALNRQHGLKKKRCQPIFLLASGKDDKMIL